MKQIKRSIGIPCIWTMIVLLSACLASCADSKPNQEASETDTRANTTVNEYDTSEQPSEDEPTLCIAENGASAFRLVYAENVATEVMDAILELNQKIEEATGVQLPMVIDNGYSADAYAIIIGRTAYPESAQAYAEWDCNQYGFRVIGKKIVVGGLTDNYTVAAIDQLWSALKKGTTDGTMKLSENAEKTVTLGAYCKQVPLPSSGNQNGIFDCSGGTLEFCYENETAEDYRAYLSMLKQSGYTEHATNQIGENLFATMVSDENFLQVAYVPAHSEMRIVAAPAKSTVLPPIQPDTEDAEKVSETKLCVFGLNTEFSDSNGMCYVFTLEDGRYLIYDGGLDSDCDALYEYLCSHNARKDGKVVIAAWIITHSHGDHYAGFRAFANKYADQVTLEYAIGNGASESMFKPGLEQWDNYLTIDFRKDAAKFEGVKIIKIHAGQKMKFSGVTIDVLYTHEMLYPTKIWDINESSTVTRVTVNGQTILFTGDALNNATDDMLKIYGNALKSDILQVNHHGSYDKMRAEFHEAVRPSVALYSTSQESFDEYKTYPVNQALLDMVDFVIVADTKCTILTLPFSGQEDIVVENPND